MVGNAPTLANLGTKTLRLPEFAGNDTVKNQLENLYQQQAAAKEEVGKPFPFEDDLRVKSARLVELDTLLNIDGKGHAQPETVVAKSARPSVLDSLKRPVPPRSLEKKPKQHEEVR